MNVTRNDFIRQALDLASTSKALVEHHVYAVGPIPEADWETVTEMFAVVHGGCMCFQDSERTDTSSWVEASGLAPETFDLRFAMFCGATPQIHDYAEWDSGLSTERIWEIWTLEFGRIAEGASPEVILESLSRVCLAFTHRMLST